MIRFFCHADFFIVASFFWCEYWSIHGKKTMFCSPFWFYISTCIVPLNQIFSQPNNLFSEWIEHFIRIFNPPPFLKVDKTFEMRLKQDMVLYFFFKFCIILTVKSSNSVHVLVLIFKTIFFLSLFTGISESV